MWNRVLLLASGLACGWMIVHTQSVADQDIKGQRIRLILGIMVGLGLVVWLSWNVFSAGLLALVVFSITALIAYSANARQVNRLVHALPPRAPVMPEHMDAGTVVLLVTSAEPAHYTGPAYWARALRHYSAAPHWFFWPRLYSRIRKAYRSMDGTHPLDTVLRSSLSTLSNNIAAPAAIRYAYLGEERAFLSILINLVEEGFDRLALVPLEDEKEVTERMHDLVLRSGITEAQWGIAYARPSTLAVTTKTRREERLANMLNGKEITLPAVPPNELDVLCTHISAYLVESSPGSANNLMQEQGW